MSHTAAEHVNHAADLATHRAAADAATHHAVAAVRAARAALRADDAAITAHQEAVARVATAYATARAAVGTLDTPDYVNNADDQAELAEGMAASAIEEAYRATRYAAVASADQYEDLFPAREAAEQATRQAVRYADAAEVYSDETGAIALEASSIAPRTTASVWAASGYASGCAKMARRAADNAEAAAQRRSATSWRAQPG